MGNKNKDAPHPNVSVVVSSIMMKNVTVAVLETKYGKLYENSKICVPLRTTLEEKNWPQGITQITTDNSTVDGIVRKLVPTSLSCRLFQRCMKAANVTGWTYVTLYLR